MQGTASGQDHHEDERVRGRGPGQVVQAGRRLGLGLGARGLLRSAALSRARSSGLRSPLVRRGGAGAAGPAAHLLNVAAGLGPGRRRGRAGSCRQ